jgi:hypothetical protein
MIVDTVSDGDRDGVASLLRGRRLSPVAQPTRRYHVLSAVRPTSLRLDVDAVRELVAAGALLVDVRRHEDASAVVEGARRIPPDEIPSLVGTLPRGTPIILACT